MRIIYVANHNQKNSNNDDEGAITHALQELGHSVTCIYERYGSRARSLTADLVLFHKWDDHNTLRHLEGRMPSAFWYFDMLASSTQDLESHCRARVAKREKVLEHADFGFCTDGNWVRQRNDPRLHWLPQGADERVLGRGAVVGTAKGAPIIYAGSLSIGAGRPAWITAMRRYWGDRFARVSGCHGRALADAIAGASVVVAPDTPGDSFYWSNRVYVSLGFGAFLLHPWYEGIVDHYEDGKEIVYYRGMSDLHAKISHYTARPVKRQAIAEAGLERTRKEHLYRHRVERLLQIVQGGAP